MLSIILPASIFGYIGLFSTWLFFNTGLSTHLYNRLIEQPYGKVKQLFTSRE